MIVYKTKGREYRSPTALEILSSLESEAEGYPYKGNSARTFLQWSLGQIGDRVSPRELDLSDRMDEEALALNFLYLCDEYGLGQISTSPDENPDESPAGRPGGA